MAINLDDRYPGRANPRSLEYPQGSFKDRTAPDAQDGTYLQQDWANDIVGFLQYLLANAGIQANGVPDTALESQYARALESLVKEWVTIVQTTGSSTDRVMSQKAVTDALNDKVGLSGNQTVGGIKTFSSFPVTPSAAPTANYQAANKKYVDDSAIGVGQTWQDVTGSRDLDTTYTNTTGKAIMVVQVSEYLEGVDPLEVFVDNVKIMSVDQGFNTGWYCPVSFIVPAGSSYRIKKKVYPNIQSWAELR